MTLTFRRRHLDSVNRKVKSAQGRPRNSSPSFPPARRVGVGDLGRHVQRVARDCSLSAPAPLEGGTSGTWELSTAGIDGARLLQLASVADGAC